MLRVSSRQRLVSWDAFDANVIVNSDYESSAEDDETGEATSILDYDTAQETSFRSVVDVNENNDTTTGAVLLGPKDIRGDKYGNTSPVVGRKRYRNAFRDALHFNDKGTVIGPTTDETSPKAVPKLVPGYAWEFGSLSFVSSLTSPTSATSLASMAISASACDFYTDARTFDDLMGDIHLVIISFLDLSSIRCIMAVNHYYRQLMLSEDAMTSLWMEYCKHNWHLSKKETSATILVDNFSLPMAATSGGNLKPESLRPLPPVNIPLLLSMTPKDLPTEVDQDLVHGRMSRRHWRLRDERAASTAPSTSNNQILFYNEDSTGRPLVRYCGTVGSGDRCVRANHALPKPRASKKKEEPIKSHCLGVWEGGLGLGYHLDGQYHQHYRSNPLLTIISRTANKMVGRGGDANSLSSSCSSPSSQGPQWTPFVMPFVDNKNKELINVTPRLVAYYEVSIMENSEDDNKEDVEDHHHPMGALMSTTSSRSNDCVAVGVATVSFPFHSRMPGWDLQSFGYHGDDGGIFHSSGGMVKQYGPTFGAGDTVGCGVDYVEQGIFFTLNGKFLGYAWKGIGEEFMKNELFPVVGIDTNCPVHLNFGANGGQAFQFDLASFLMKDEIIIAPHYRFSSLDDGVDDDGGINRRRNGSSRSNNNDSSRSNGSHRGLFHRRFTA